jgi:hypothetical protein
MAAGAGKSCVTVLAGPDPMQEQFHWLAFVGWRPARVVFAASAD